MPVALVTGLSPGEALDRAYKETIVSSAADKAAFLLEALGPRLAAVGCGLTDARQVKAWSVGESRPRGDAADRLRILFHVAYAVAAVYGSDTAATFVRGANPGLDDRSVLSVLAGEPPTDLLEKRLVGVARDFLTG